MDAPGTGIKAMAALNPFRPRNPLTFPKADAPFSYELFRKPTAEYRGCPLWAWNAKLDKEAMIRQIGYLQEMGFGGFHMHVRTGLDTEYMGDEFMDIVKTCVDVAEDKGMMACLHVSPFPPSLCSPLTSHCRYDEDRWPSGVAGGKVVENHPEYKGKHLLFTPTPYGQGRVGGCSPSSAAACRSENGRLLARYGIRLNAQDGTLKAARLLNRMPRFNGEHLAADETIWYAYVETNPPSEWFNGQTYVDTLSPAAMRKFVDVTHEKYKECVGDKFGTTVPCIFTDEPQFATKTRLSHPFAKEDLFLPWTNDLPETFHRTYSADLKYRRGRDPLITSLPELFWNLPGNHASLLRYRFHDHVCERFVSAFMDQLGAWCASNNIHLNGHMMEEPTLESQTHSLGEAMRCYRSQTLPGIDLLSDMVEYNTAKQASSVVRQNGIRGCMSEIYGCTHWYFTFEGHKGCGDWQAALGVTFRVPHLAWASMAGEAKRDYPASINYQSPWFREYGYVEDHFARVGVAMTRGRAVTRVAVIHPIESFWLVFGPGDPGGKMAERDQRFKELTDWLLHGLIDFDFISESLLPEQEVDIQGKSLVVGKCTYDAVILPDLVTIRSATLSILDTFAGAGGYVVVAGNQPILVDAQHAVPSPLFHCGCFVEMPWDRGAILNSIDKFRELDIFKRGTFDRAKTLLYQMRQDGKERFVFICNTDRISGVDTKVILRGRWKIELLDTLNGENRCLESYEEHNYSTNSPSTLFEYKFEGCQSALLRLVPRPYKDISPLRLPFRLWGPPLPKPPLPLTLDGVELTEQGTNHAGQNVLMLDYAKYWITGDECWSHVQEILALNNEILDRLRLPRKGMAWRQPWTISPADREPKANVTLVFQFMSDFDVPGTTFLAVELPEGAQVTLNENDITSYGVLCSTEALSKERGDWFVDEAISTIPIPGNTIERGVNNLYINFPCGMLTPVERVYLLGDFRVEIAQGAGPDLLARAKITPSEELTSWGDITAMGLPFYVGNLTYKCSFTLTSRSKAILSVPQFSSPVLAVEWTTRNEKKRGHIAFQPRALNLGTLDAGKHSVSITAYGNRYNAFGHIHAQDWMTNCWPDAWRTQGWAWSDEYRVKPIGILERPTIITFTEGGRDRMEPGTPEAQSTPVTPNTPPWDLVSRPSTSGHSVPSRHPRPTFRTCGLSGSPIVSRSSTRPGTHNASGSSSRPGTPGSWVQVSPPPETRNSFLPRRSEQSDADFFSELNIQVHDARYRLEELWDLLETPEDERLEFTGDYFEVFSTTLLGVLELEIARLQAVKGTLDEQRSPAENAGLPSSSGTVQSPPGKTTQDQQDGREEM
ncbi:hypothetical protein CONLIGDRAFT_695548 [Coniochaeta ligniaria NRRL 30616]|uniref:Uncharacterized protein n=1 Tax=Coniochaeta ligniaria NRRL 30616 TaxID=1408157 RepID=A0A1J7JZ82_9PEZI|nr:hypothetical protein CONLIGDRAFT_695548 [Coniochaeta ligniaria NRRL 30616]